MYKVVISLNEKQQVHEHPNYASAFQRWRFAVEDVEAAMEHMGNLRDLFEAKIYMTHHKDGKIKIIMAFDSKGRLEFV